MSRRTAFLTVCVLSFVFAGRGLADERAAKQALSEHGIRVLGSSLAFEDESKLSKALRDVTKLRKSLFDADKQLKRIQQQTELLKKATTALRRQHVELNAQLSRVTSVVANNRLVGLINAVVGKINLATQQQEQISKHTKETRAEMVKSREAYIQHVLDMRELADKISEQYTVKAADNDVDTALAELNKATGKEYELTPSRGFQSTLLRLKKLEDSVLSETIPLRKGQGGSLFVTVVFNGKHNEELAVHSGASVIALPHKIATACDLEPSASDPTVMMRLADGTVIPAKMITISEVRVGKFTVKDVECAVFSPEATQATPLLGMSFLGRFEFEIDAQAGKLNMVKVETATSKTSSRKNR